MPRPRHNDVYEAMQNQIKAATWQLIDTAGIAKISISMREIAQRMEMSAPALYNYFANQDALITALILDGFNTLADALDNALADTQTQSPYQQFKAIGNAYHAWVLANRRKYLLIYGTPLDNYEAPREITVPTAVRIFIAVTQPIQRAHMEQGLNPRSPYDVIPADQQQILEQLINENGFPTAPLCVYLSFVAFSRLYGLVMPAIVGHMVPLNTVTFFETGLEGLCLDIGFKPD
jgi:AcrR family transcriptional regulator